MNIFASKNGSSGITNYTHIFQTHSNLSCQEDISHSSKNLTTILKESKIIDDNGCLIQKKKDEQLPQLEKSQLLSLQELFNKPFNIKAGDFQGQIKISGVLSAVSDYYAASQWEEPKIEIVGGYVRWLMVQSPNFCHTFLNRLGVEGNFPSNFFESLVHYPSDYDIRILLPKGANQEDIRALMDIIVSYLSSAISKECSQDVKKEIVKSGLKKKFISPDATNKYGVLSFGSCSKNSSLELLLVSHLKREFTFTHTALKLGSSEGQWFLTTTGDFGWQAMVDILTKQLHAVSPETIDHQGWAQYHSYLLKGYSCSDPNLEKILFDSIKKPNSPIETLLRCLSNHHNGQKEAALAALSINTYYMNSEIAETIWKTNEPSNTAIKKANLDKEPLEYISEVFKNLDLPLKFLTNFLEVMAIFNNCAQLTEHKQKLYLQIRLQDPLFLMLPYNPLESLNNLQGCIPKKLNNNQNLMLMHLFSTFLFSETIWVSMEEKQEVYKKGYEWIDAKDILFRNLGYQILLHSYKENPVDSLLKLLLIRFPEPYINFNPKQKISLLNLVKNTVKIKVPPSIFADFDTHQSESINPTGVLEIWLKSLASSADPLLMDCAYAIWLSSIKKFSQEQKLNLGKTLIESYLPNGQRYCVSILIHLAKVNKNNEVLLKHTQRVIATLNNATDIEILFSLKQALKLFQYETNAKDSLTLLLINQLRARGCIDEAKDLLEEIKDKKNLQDQESIIQWDEFACEMDEVRWNVALPLAISLIQYNQNFNHEKGNKHIGILISNLNSLYNDMPQLSATFFQLLLSRLFNDSANANKELCKQVIEYIVIFSKQLHVGSNSLPSFVINALSGYLDKMFDFLKNENQIHLSYLLLKEIEKNEFLFQQAYSYSAFLLWFINKTVQEKQASPEMYDWIDNLFSRVFKQTDLFLNTPIIIERFVDHYIVAGMYDKALSLLENGVDNFIVSRDISCAGWLFKSLRILILKLDFSKMASFIIKNRDYLKKINSETTKNLAENLVRISPKQVLGNEFLLLDIINKFDIKVASLWQYTFQIISESKNIYAQSELGKSLIEKENDVFNNFPLERASCWLAALKCRLKFPLDTLISLLLGDKILHIFASPQCKKLALNAFKELYSDVLVQIDNEGMAEKAVVYLVELKTAFGFDFVDCLVSSLFQTENQKIIRQICQFSNLFKFNFTFSTIQMNNIIFLSQRVSRDSYSVETKIVILAYIENHIDALSQLPQAFDVLELLLSEPIQESLHTIELLARETIDNFKGPITEQKVKIIERVIQRFIEEPCLCCIERAANLLQLTDISNYFSADSLFLMFINIVNRNFDIALNDNDLEDLEGVFNKFIHIYCKNLNKMFLKQWVVPLSKIIFQLELEASECSEGSIGLYLTKACSALLPEINIVMVVQNEQDEDPIAYLINSWPAECEKSYEAIITYELCNQFLKHIANHSFTESIGFKFFRFYGLALLDKMLKTSPWLDFHFKTLDYISLFGDFFFEDCHHHDLYIIKTLKQLVNQKKKFEDLTSFFSLAFSTSNFNYEKLPPEDRLGYMFNKDSLMPGKENDICLEVINTFLDKSKVDYQAKGLGLFSIWIIQYSKSNDKESIKNILKNVLCCFKGLQKNNDVISTLYQQTVKAVEYLLNHFKNEWWNEYGVYFFREIMFTIIDKFDNLQDVSELNSFVLLINNILLHSYYKTNIIDKFPHAYYDIFQKILKKLQSSSFLSASQSKHLLIAIIGLLVNLNSLDKQKNTTLENQIFTIHSQPKTFHPMKLINTQLRIPLHGKQAKQIWAECLQISTKMYIQLLSKGELEQFKEILVSYEELANKIKDKILIRELKNVVVQVDLIIKKNNS